MSEPLTLIFDQDSVKETKTVYEREWQLHSSEDLRSSVMIELPSLPQGHVRIRVEVEKMEES